MRFLKESIDDLSVDAIRFLSKNPEFEKQITDFETEFNISGLLDESDELRDFLTDNMLFSYSGEYDDCEVDVDYRDFGTPELSDVNYLIDKDGNLYLEASVTATADTTVGTNWYSGSYDEPPGYLDEKDVTVTASAYLEVSIPKDVTDYDAYIFDGEDDIEYEIEG